MKGPSGGISLLCVNFCAYYKPGKKEELACEGFRVVRRLLEKGRDIPLAKRGTAPGREVFSDMLRATMCINCTFSEADCDYYQAVKEAPPCGGFLLLHRLLDTGEITMEEIISC